MSIAKQLAALGASPEMIANSLCNGRPITELDRTTSNITTAGRFESAGVLRIVVPGAAPGKPRMTRADKWKKRPAVIRYREWCDLVRSIAGDVPSAENVQRIVIEAFYEPPQSWSKRKRCAAIGELHRNRVDADNALKGLLDCLWPDGDQAIADVSIRKRWDWHARLEIEIYTNSRAAAGGTND